MKTKKIILFVTANAIAAILIISFVQKRNMLKKYGERFRSNSFIMSDSILIHANAKEVYQFYIHNYPLIYDRTAEKHHEFRLLNSDSIAPGVQIYCVEGEKHEMIYHNYIVREAEPNKLIYFSSEPSTIEVMTKIGVQKNYCNAFVFVDFMELGKQQSTLKFTITMQMPNYFYKLIGRIAGGRKAKKEWEDHLKEELEGFRDEYYRALAEYTPKH